MEELDEFGIPIRKPKAEVDEFGIHIKKKILNSTSNGGSTPVLSGSELFPSIDTKTPSVLTPKGKAEYQEQVKAFKPQEVAKEGQPKPPKKADGGGATAFMKGLNDFNSNVFKTPRLLYDAASSITDTALQALNLQQDETNYDDIVAASGYNSPLSVLERLGDYYAAKSNQYAQRQEKFDKGIVDSFTSGDYKNGGKQLWNNIAGSIPSMIGMAVTGGAGNIAKLKYAQKIIVSALPFISGRNAELTEDESIPKPVRVVNATLNGLSEVIFDQSFGTQAMIGKVVDAFKNEGRDAAVKVAKDFTKGFATEAIKKIQPFTGTIKGTVEEMSTQLSQNIVDKYTINPEKELTEGLLDAGLVGGTMTGGISALGTVAYSSSQKKKAGDLMKQREEIVDDLDNDNLPDDVKEDLSDKLSKIDESITKIDNDNESVVSKLSDEDKTVLKEKDAKIQSIEQALQDESLSETAKETLADRLLKEQDKVDEILTKVPDTEQSLIEEGKKAEAEYKKTDDQVTYEQKMKELDKRANALPKEEIVETIIEEPNATQTGKIEQSNITEREGVTEQQQGGQEDRVNQEELITEAKSETSSGDSVVESREVEEVKAPEITPNKSVKANQKIASQEIAKARKIRETDGEVLFAQFKDKRLYDAEVDEKSGEIPKDTFIELDDVPPMLKGVFKRLEDSGLIEEIDERYYLTNSGKDFNDAVQSRLSTRKAVKSGTDMFPTEAGLSEAEVPKKSTQPHEKAKTEEVKRPIETPRVAESKGESTKEQSAKAEVDEAVKDLLDFVKKSRGTATSFANVGDFSAKMDKVLIAYAKLGIVKLEDVIEKLRKDVGNDFVDDNKDAIQDAWTEANGGKKKTVEDFEVKSEPKTPKQEKEPVEEPKEVSGIKKALVPDNITVDIDKMSDKAFQELGKSLIESGEVKPRDITLEIGKGSPRALQPKEVVALIYYKTTLDNQKRELLIERNKLSEQGENTSVIDGKLSDLQDDIDLFDATALITAQQQSLAFRLRKGLLDRDYNLVTQIEQYKKVNNGVIPPEIEAKFREYDRELSELKDKIKDAESKLIAEQEKKSIGNIVEDVERSNKTRKSVLTPKEQARKKELANKYRVFNDATRFLTILAEKDFREYATLILKEAKGDFQLFGAEILKTLGVDSKKYLPELYESIGGKGKIDLDALIEKPTVTDGILNIPKNYIRDLVNEGVTDINKLSQKVLEEIQKDLPDITIREVRDAITDYGKTVNQTADEVQKQINEAKRLGRLYSQLEDLEKGKSKAKWLKDVLKISIDEKELRRKIKAIESLLPKSIQEEARRTEAKKEYFRRFIQEKEERLKNKNFAPKSKSSPLLSDSELNDLEAKAHEVKDRYDEAHYENEQNNRTTQQKVYDTAIEWGSGIQRALQAGLDFSALGVQGIIQLLSTNPKKTLTAIKEGFKFMGSEKYEKEFFARIKADPLYPVMKKSGLALQYPNSKLGTKDYQLSGSVINKIWNGMMYPLKLVNPKLYERAKLLNPYRATERAFTGTIDTIRVQLFKQFAKDLEMQGITPESDPNQYKIAANATNNLTFRGRLRFAEPIAKELAVLYFAPRKITATISLTNPGYWASLWLTSPTVAKRATLKMATFITLATTITLATKAFRDDDDEDENPDVFNPLSADFMKLRLGNTRINFFGGLDPNVIFFARMLTNKYKSSGSSQTKKLGENKYVPTRLDLLMIYNTNKFAPTSGMAYRKLSEGQGRMFDWETEMQDAAIPIWTHGINELQQEHPTEIATFLTMMNFFGLNMSTYGNADFLDKDKDKREIDLIHKKNASFFEKVRANIEVLDPETGEERGVTKPEFDKYKKTYGEYIKNDLKAKFEEYKVMPVEDFEKEMSKVKRRATEQAKEYISGITPAMLIIEDKGITYQLTPEQIKERKAINDEYIKDYGKDIYDAQIQVAIEEGKSMSDAKELADKKVKSSANTYSKSIMLEKYTDQDGNIKIPIKD